MRLLRSSRTEKVIFATCSMKKILPQIIHSHFSASVSIHKHNLQESGRKTKNKLQMEEGSAVTPAW